jgi:N-hydroxyarylamine O-acetyltransferase
MTLTHDELQAYLSRLGATDELPANLATLQLLHDLHPRAIAFENLDSWLGQPVSLQPVDVFGKLLLNDRGGYCFEHNQLFQRVLKTLGYEVYGLSARVLWMLPENTVLPRTHMALLVVVQGKRYLADVGFGGLTMTGPLDLDSSGIQATPHENFRLQRKLGQHIVSAELAGQWQDLYAFSLERCLPEDYETANWYVSTHPQSRFTTQLIAARPEHGGRHALLDRRYSWYQTGQPPQTIELRNASEVLAVLQDRMLIDTGKLEGLQHKLEGLFGAPHES